MVDHGAYWRDVPVDFTFVEAVDPTDEVPAFDAIAEEHGLGALLPRNVVL